ncbi:dihydropteroate synthase [Robertkochia marina]|uniref:Dihydropteroate synthase n=1 Tax=Robertkochia marina TaxID=1227945 RepID=A0A4S3M096_9FLAO|nr:dihydropteroate synthase [Robertkochia marina]THD66427.1 dihydropteroate synthase [Robertkochia marina]TRZ44104.1 dihydropteroate synthase [Robertkochia marina]
MTINCKGTLVNLSSPKVMGILNVTPDSFYDGGRYNDETALLQQAEQMLEDGADFIDVGGYSSRPGADDIAEEEELRRTVEATTLILKNFPDALISIDTFRAKVAKENIGAGAAIINDISGGTLDENMIPLAGQLAVPYIMMHMKGTPQNMKQMATYDDLLKEITFFFSQQIAKARDHKVNDVIIDPGFGFAKNIEQNFTLLQHLDHLSILDKPILAGVSRKSMIYKTLGISPDEALNGTTVLNTLCLQKGANILRVHDVKEAVQCVNLFGRMTGEK